MNSFSSLLTKSFHNGHINHSYNGQTSQTGFDIEQAIRTSDVPIASNEKEEATALGYHGVLINKNDTQNSQFNHYKLNIEPNPEVIRKKNSQPIEYNQDITIRWLRPPTVQSGDIVIKQQPDTILPAAPPLVIRQNAAEPHTPETKIYREQPPEPPSVAPTKVINVPGKVIEPPRKVIIEKMAPLPPKPENVIIEKWLPYTEAPRRVVYEAAPKVALEPIKNLLVEWDPVEANVKKRINHVFENSDPKEYVTKYGSSLLRPSDIPYYADIHQSSFETSISNNLVGDIESLKILDSAILDREGLAQYKHYLK